MTCLLVPGRDETKTNLLVDTADAAIYSVLFFFVCLFVRVCFSWRVQYVGRSYKYPPYFIHSIKAMSNMKRQHSSKVVKS